MANKSAYGEHVVAGANIKLATSFSCEYHINWHVLDQIIIGIEINGIDSQVFLVWMFNPLVQFQGVDGAISLVDADNWEVPCDMTRCDDIEMQPLKTPPHVCLLQSVLGVGSTFMP